MEDIIKNMFITGSSIQEISDGLKISKSTVCRKLKKIGLKHKNRIKRKVKPIKNNINGIKFGNLLVVDRSYNEKYKTWDAVCVCDCGRKVIRFASQLLENKCKSCGIKGCVYHDQYHINSGKLNANFSGYEKISGQRWAEIKHGALRRNIEFKIDIKDAWKTYLKQEGKCAITGLPIDFQKTSKSERIASLDRIDSGKGYTIDNIQWVHKIINIMKKDMEMIEFVKWCKLVYENNKNLF